MSKMLKAVLLTPSGLRAEAQEHEVIADELHFRALTLEEQLSERGDEWKPSEARLCASLRARATYHQNAAILCRLKALEMERGGSG